MVSSSGIYVIINGINGKKYVGQSIDVERRKAEHFRSLRSGTHYNDYLQRSYNKYGGDNIEFIVLERCGERLLNDRESYWINKLDTQNKLVGYNLRAGGDKPKLSEYSRLKISNTRKKRIQSGLIKQHKIIFTDEVKKKMSKNLKLYFSNESVRRELSLNNTPYDIIKIKTLLKDDLQITPKEVADKFGVSVNSINHIIALASHGLILKEYNYVIKNRNNILFERNNKKIKRMYRDGYSYSEIGKVVGLHYRNVIRRVNKYCDENDARMRLNNHNYAKRKKRNLIKTLYKMGNNYSEVGRKLNISRGNVYNCVKGNTFIDSKTVKEVRKKVNPIEYRNTIIGENI